MPDTLAWRRKIAVAVPSTNTILQPDFDDLRPAGVTNHATRISVPNMEIKTDDDFIALINACEGELYNAVDRVMTAAPDYLVVGISSLMTWDGLEASTKRRDALAAHAGVPVTGGSFAAAEGLRRLGAKRLAVLSPYMPVADAQTTRFLTECGFEVLRFKGLCCPSPIAIAEVSEAEIRRQLLALDGDDVDAIFQMGTNLSALRVAVELEETLGKPVVSINGVTYWHALRENGITDRFTGYGSLFAEH